MKSIRKLIERITYPTLIANEDVNDTVQQYWDDVTQDYWEATDKDIADELGVTPTALSELLEVHRHTFNYANIGGNSSVRGYDHGEDWMVVMFSDGSRYLYTLKSTTREALDLMRKYAIEGKGLNSYIMRLQRMNYAGRNVKGEILIKPGMESYNPEGYKRLQLLVAFRNTMNTQISNEGIFDSIKKFMGMSNKGDLKTIWRSQDTSRLLREIQTNFGSPNWLNKQTLRKGQIDNKGIADVLVIGNNVNAMDALKATYPYVKMHLKYMTDIKAYQAKTKPALDILIKNSKKLDKAIYDEVKRLVDQVDTGPINTIKWPATAITGKASYATPNMVMAKYTPVDISIDALDRNELQNVLTAILDTLKNIEMVKFELPDLPKELDNIIYDLAGNNKPIGGVSYDAWNNLLFSCFSPNESDQAGINRRRQKESFVDIVVACLKWMDRSIKGKVSVENINNAVGNEVYVKSTLKKYRDQIDAAGVDGLTPVAQQIMQVGLEAIGIEGIALENHDVGKELTTEKLKQAIDSRLTEDSE